MLASVSNVKDANRKLEFLHFRFTCLELNLSLSKAFKSYVSIWLKNSVISFLYHQ